MWKFEKRFIDSNEIEEGVLKEKHLLPLTLVLLTIFLIIPALFTEYLLYPYWVYAVVAVFSARLIAIDLRHFLLPNVYAIPLLLVGIAISAIFGVVPLLESILGVIVGFLVPFTIAYGIYKWKGSAAGFGGGDMKLMAACGAWIGVTALPLFIMLTCVLSFLVSLFAFKNNHIPFGPGLCGALLLILFFQKHIVNYISLL
jgi:leader peptidase (prepilin peptidase)/N-methyltransferase